MHFVVIVPLGLAIFFIIVKTIVVSVLLLVGGIAWLGYKILFGKDD
jgi:hypothetical protein